jgi:hypothetical protein
MIHFSKNTKHNRDITCLIKKISIDISDINYNSGISGYSGGFSTGGSLGGTYTR